MKENIIWDTSLNPIDYPKEIKEKYFKLCVENRKKFINWFGSASSKYEKKFDWWIKLPSSRDPYKSNLFKNFIILKVLEDKIITRKIKKIFFENKIFLQVLRNNEIFNIERSNIYFKKTKSNFYYVISSIIFSLLVYIIVKSLGKKEFRDKKKSITLIENYLDVKSDIKDFVFSNLTNYLTAKQNKNIFFVPNFLFSKNIYTLIKNLKALSVKNYIFKENFITFYEFLKCCTKTFISYKQFKGNNFVKFNNIDLSLLILDEIYSKSNFYSEFQSNLKLLFIKNLQNSKIKVKKVINRFENQATDRAWNFGFRHYFPKIENYGYQDFLYYPHLSNQSPTSFEEKANILPKNIIITSNLVKRSRSEFCSKQKFILGPSLNKQNIFKNQTLSYRYKFVVALCGIKSIDKQILKWIIFSLEKDKNLKIFVKPHPILPLDKLKSLKFEKLKRQLIILNDKIDTLLPKTEILITSGPTSIIYESIVYGCKLFYLFLDPSDLIFKKKLSFPKKNFSFVSNREILLISLQYWNKKKHIKKKQNLKYHYYTKVSKTNLRFFI